MVRSSRRGALLGACVVGVCAASAGAAATSPIAPPGAKVAGRGYSQWLTTSWKYLLGHAPGLGPCQTINGVLVTFNGVAGKKVTDTCAVRRGQPAYIRGLSVECSTVEPAPFHGDTPAQLEACAKRDYALAVVSVTLDGRVVDHARYATASRTFAVRLPKKNILGSKTRNARLAAYGDGFLLKHLSPGAHHLHLLITAPGFHADVTYTLNVAG